MTAENEIVKEIETKYKDRLFRMIFGKDDERSKKWRLELYNALSGKKHTNPDDIKLTTIENAIYITMKNDLSFLVDSQMTLCEQQSTYNPNMPLRGLFYFSQLYQIHLTQIEKDLYGSNLIKIPAPRYFVFYNGPKTHHKDDVSKLRLSNAFENFDEHGDFEWTATVININADHNNSLQKNCKPLYDYISYVDRIKQNLAKDMKKQDAINEAVDWACAQNLLEGFFREHKAMIAAVSLTEFDQELYDKCRREEGRKEGLEEGAQQKAIEAANNLLKMNILTVEQIAQAQGLTVEKVCELKTQLEAQTVNK